MVRTGLISFLLCLYSTLSLGQILDDSTQNVYGVHTTRFITEDQLLFNDTVQNIIDTSINRIHLFNYVDRNNYLYQNLGNMGTAMQAIFYQLPDRIGTRWGVQVYAPFVPTINDIKYYDTKSPFTSLYFVQGGKGQQHIQLEFSRNINERWNVSLMASRLNAHKQFAGTGIRTEDDILAQYTLNFNTRYTSKDKRYTLLAHYQHFNSPLLEQGGILLDTEAGETQDDMFDYLEEEAQLAGSPRSWQLQNRWHVYHQYQLNKPFQVFHAGTYSKQRDSYTDDEYEVNSTFYGTVRPRFTAADPVAGEVVVTQDNYEYHQVENQVGIKGRYGPVDYITYFKRRDYKVKNGSYDSLYQPGGGENFIGAQVRLNLWEKFSLDAKGEYLLGGDYLLEGMLSGRFLEAGIKSYYYRPALVERFYVSNSFNWNNNFNTTFANEFYAGLRLKYRSFFLKPFVRYHIVDQYVYFRKTINDDLEQTIQAVQEDKTMQILQVGGMLEWSWRNIYWQSSIRFTRSIGESTVKRFPEVWMHSSLFYKGYIYKDIVYFKAGVEHYYKSDYFADAYMPAIKQFYYQDEFLVKAYHVLDVFASIQISKVRVFLKWNHANQNMFTYDGVKPEGYAVTPYYAGMARTLSLGFQWLFFD